MAEDDTEAPEDIAWAAGVLERAAAHERLRLRRGLLNRRALQAAAEQGEVVAGPRAAWLRTTALRLIDALEAAADAYNLAHQDDLISAADMADATNTALQWLRAEAQQQEPV